MRVRRAFGIAAAVVLGGFLAFASYCAYRLWAPPSIQYRGKMKAGAEAARRIETFRSRTGRLPENLAEVGLPDDERGPIYYTHEGNDHYVVSFGTILGESMTYDSATRRWQ